MNNLFNIFLHHEMKLRGVSTANKMRPYKRELATYLEWNFFDQNMVSFFYRFLWFWSVKDADDDFSFFLLK